MLRVDFSNDTVDIVKISDTVIFGVFAEREREREREEKIRQFAVARDMYLHTAILARLTTPVKHIVGITVRSRNPLKVLASCRFISRADGKSRVIRTFEFRRIINKMVETLERLVCDEPLDDGLAREQT